MVWCGSGVVVVWCGSGVVWYGMVWCGGKVCLHTCIKHCIITIQHI